MRVAGDWRGGRRGGQAMLLPEREIWAVLFLATTVGHRHQPLLVRHTTSDNPTFKMTFDTVYILLVKEPSSGLLTLFLFKNHIVFLFFSTLG